MSKSLHKTQSISYEFIVCKTLQDVEEAKKKYLAKKGLRLRLSHCVFQSKYTKLNRVKNDK